MQSLAYEGQERQKDRCKGRGLELESEQHIVSSWGPAVEKVLATSIPASMRLREPYGSVDGGD